MTAVLTVGIFALSGCSSPKMIDFKEFTSITCEGGNGSGYAAIKVDYEAIAAMLGDQNAVSALVTVSSFNPLRLRTTENSQMAIKLRLKSSIKTAF